MLYLWVRMTETLQFTFPTATSYATDPNDRFLPVKVTGGTVIVSPHAVVVVMVYS